jgi:hypothetical protein
MAWQVKHRLTRFATAKFVASRFLVPSVLVLGCGLIAKRLEVVDNVLTIFLRGKTFEGHECTGSEAVGALEPILTSRFRSCPSLIRIGLGNNWLDGFRGLGPMDAKRSS